MVKRELYDKLYDMPSNVRDKIRSDFKQLVGSPMTGNSLIKFYRDINSVMGNKTKQLSTLKDSIQKGISKIDPNLAMDFAATNTLYSKYADISNRLKPTIASDLLSATTIPKVIYGMFSGNYPLIYEAVGEQAARKLSSELLLNPRFQNLSKQIVSSLNSGKIPVTTKLMDKFIEYTSEVDPDLASQIEEFDWESFLSNHKSKK